MNGYIYWLFLERPTKLISHGMGKASRVPNDEQRDVRGSKKRPRSSMENEAKPASRPKQRKSSNISKEELEAYVDKVLEQKFKAMQQATIVAR
jgi:hypothetical protein